MTRLEQFGIVAVVGVVALGLGYSFGRYSTPERVVEHVRTAEVERNAETTGVRTSDDERVSTAFVRVLETKPDGTTIATERVEAVREVVKEVEVVRTVEVERVVYREKELLIESPKPAWRVALDLGVADAPHRVDVPGIPRYLPVVASISAERRIVGPVFVGAWASSTPAAGLRISLEF